MKNEAIIAEIAKIKVTANGKTAAHIQARNEIATRLEPLLAAKGLEIRKGSSRTNSKNGCDHLYVVKAGDKTTREHLWKTSFTTLSGGYFRTQSPSGVTEALEKMLAFVEGFAA